MRRRSLVIFVVLNVLISLGVAAAVITLFNRNSQPTPTSLTIQTVQILVTATIDPNVTPNVRIITATPLPGQVAGLPDDLLQTPVASTTSLDTLNAQGIVPEEGTPIAGVVTALPENCILHTIAEGDTPYAVALQYGADSFRLMEVNGLNDETASLLQIGDTLIVPLEGCPLTGPQVSEAPTLESSATGEVSGEATTESTAAATATATVRPTVTLPPTARSAQMEITNVNSPGDITAERVEIRNNGNNVNLKGWTLSDANGNVYTFAERFLFERSVIFIYSGVGTDTAAALFWNRTQPVFEAGDVVTLKDAAGRVQSTFRVPAQVDLP
jgi:LysM repeat protein